MKVSRFEDLVAWQKARALTQEIYRVTKRGAWARDFGLAGQIQRAAVSTMSNDAEGFERGNRGEFHQFLSIAKSSCGEVRLQLYVTLDAGYLEQQEFDWLIRMTEEVCRIIGGLRKAVARGRKTKLSPQS
jgi:four helix bundle protein